MKTNAEIKTKIFKVLLNENIWITYYKKANPNEYGQNPYWRKEESRFLYASNYWSFARFESHIMRIDVHLKDVNGKKAWFNDILWLLEARLKASQPIAITNQAESTPLAVTGAVNKIKTAIEKRS